MKETKGLRKKGIKPHSRCLQGKRALHRHNDNDKDDYEDVFNDLLIRISLNISVCNQTFVFHEHEICLVYIHTYPIRFCIPSTGKLPCPQPYLRYQTFILHEHEICLVYVHTYRIRFSIPSTEKLPCPRPHLRNESYFMTTKFAVSTATIVELRHSFMLNLPCLRSCL